MKTKSIFKSVFVLSIIALVNPTFSPSRSNSTISSFDTDACSITLSSCSSSTNLRQDTENLTNDKQNQNKSENKAMKTASSVNKNIVIGVSVVGILTLIYLFKPTKHINTNNEAVEFNKMILQ